MFYSSYLEEKERQRKTKKEKDLTGRSVVVYGAVVAEAAMRRGAYGGGPTAPPNAPLCIFAITAKDLSATAQALRGHASGLELMRLLFQYFRVFT